MEPLLTVRDLSKRFGPITAVDHIGFELRPGEVLGFLGPNGAGKSTTMKMITGYLPPDTGEVRVAGYDLAQAPLEVKQRIGYLPEGAPAYQDLTPARFLEFIAQIRGLQGRDKAQRIAQTVARVHLEPVLHQPIETLSKGFKRRVGLAQAILHDPPVLILDEPTDGLDPNQKHEVRELIRTMAADKVIILSTHILEEMEAVCNRAMVISRGRILVDATPDELVARSTEHNAVTLGLTGTTAAKARKQLQALAEVERVEELNAARGSVRLRLYPRSQASIVGRVSEAVREQGWDLDELIVERGRMDEVFRTLTTAETAELS